MVLCCPECEGKNIDFNYILSSHSDSGMVEIVYDCDDCKCCFTAAGYLQAQDVMTHGNYGECCFCDKKFPKDKFVKCKGHGCDGPVCLSCVDADGKCPHCRGDF